jgi:hypothetical protein
MDRRDPEYMDVLMWVEKDKGGVFNFICAYLHYFWSLFEATML